ncbi:hypothetical protein ES703_107410 [subsurface metagenome]
MKTIQVAVLDMTAPKRVQASRNIASSIQGRPAVKGRVMNHKAKRWEKPVTLSPSLNPKQPIKNMTNQLPMLAT